MHNLILKVLKQRCLLILDFRIKYNSFLECGGVVFLFKTAGRVYVETGFQVLFKKLAEIVAQCSGKRQAQTQALLNALRIPSE